MRFDVRILITACLVALLVPVAAVAKDAMDAQDVQGPSAVFGAGHFGGELELAGEDGQRPVRIQGRAGYIGVLDLGGDLKIRCLGKGRVQKAETEAGMVYRCAGRGGQVVLLGSHFKFRGFAMRYRALVPEGASGSWQGNRFVVRQKGDGPAGEGGEGKPGKRGEKMQGERGERFQGERGKGHEGERGEGAAKPELDEDEIPSLEELAELLEKLKG
jgi:hypothetical protein